MSEIDNKIRDLETQLSALYSAREDRGNYPLESVAPQPLPLKTEIFADRDTRSVRIEFTQGERFTAFTFAKADTHRLIEGLQKAVNSIGNRVKVK